MQSREQPTPVKQDQEDQIKQICSSDEQPQEGCQQNRKQSAQDIQNTRQEEQHYRQYMAYFDDIQSEIALDRVHFREVQRELGKFYPNLTVFNVEHSQTYEILMIEAKLGIFWGKFKLLNTKQKSPFHSCNLAGFGTHSDVYTIQTGSPKHKHYQKYAIKCLPINIDDKQTNQLREFLKQLMLLKLTNQVLYSQSYNSEPFLYFDLIHYSNCIQFAMTRLTWDQDYAENRQADLKKSLRSFHKLGLVHCDIKEENIAYNREVGSWVFIDFGLSLMVPEKQYQKSQTIFLGNLKNASPQMRKIAKKPQGGKINLYYNDYYGFKSMLNDLRANEKNKIRVQDTANLVLNQSFIQKIDQFLFILKLKFYLSGFSIDKQIIDALFGQFKEKNEPDLERMLISFMSQIKLTAFCQVFYDELLKHKQTSAEYVFSKKSQRYYLKSTRMFENTEQVSQFQTRFASLLQKPENNLSILFAPSNIKQTLNDKGKLQTLDKELYYRHVLNYISFTKNTYHNTFQQKKAVCSIFNQLFSKKAIQSPESPLQLTILNILNYCTSVPFTNWKKQHLFSVITQYFILGLGNTAKITEIMVFLQQNAKSLYQQAFMLYLLYQSLVWDHNILIKRKGFEIEYIIVLKKLESLLTKLEVIYQQRNLKQYLLERVAGEKALKYESSLENDYLLLVVCIINLGTMNNWQPFKIKIVQVLDTLLKLSSRDSFVMIYGRQVFKALLNLAVKFTHSSMYHSSSTFMDILLNFQDDQQIKYYYFSIIHTLRMIKDTKDVLNVLRKLKNSINSDELWQNSVTSYILIEQTSEQVLQNHYTSRLIQKSLEIINTCTQDSVRLVLNVFKCIQIFSLIALNMSQKQYIFIKKYCRQNYHDFLKVYPAAFTIPSMQNHVQQAYAQSQKYFKQFQKALDWMTIRYTSFIRRNLILVVKTFGKYLDVPIIMRGYNFFYLFLRAAQIMTRSDNDSIIQNRHKFFMDFLYQTTSKTDQLSAILDTYEQKQIQITPKLLFRPSNDEQRMAIFNNIDYVLAEQIRRLHEADRYIYREYLLEMILKISISMLMMIRKYDTIGDCFPMKSLQTFFLQKFFHIELQTNKAMFYKKQVLAVYVEYLGNLYSTFTHLLYLLKNQEVDVTAYHSHIQSLLTNKILSLKQILSQTRGYCFIRYFNVSKTTDVFVFKVLIKNVLSLKQKHELRQQLIDFFNIMSLVYDNKQSWKHFFIIKELLLFDKDFTAQSLAKLLQILLSIKWKQTINKHILKNYKLVRFFIYLFCSLIDSLLTSSMNNRQNIVSSPILALTSFVCVLTDHSSILRLMKIQEIMLQKLSLRDKIEVFPYLLMIAIYKAKEMKSYSLRFNMYLQKKLVKSLLVNDWGNLLITYCKQYLSMCKKTHISYFKALFAKLKDYKPKTKRFLKQKVHKYYCIENKES